MVVIATLGCGGHNARTREQPTPLHTLSCRAPLPPPKMSGNWAQELLGEKLLRKGADGKVEEVSTKDGFPDRKFVGLYFSAHVSTGSHHAAASFCAPQSRRRPRAAAAELLIFPRAVISVPLRIPAATPHVVQWCGALR